MKPREVERLLRRHGWQQVSGRGKGSHRRYSHPERDELVTLPWHNRDLPPGTLHSILKAAGIEKSGEDSR